MEMMVVSAWYTERDIGKGIKALRKVAHHASRIIHQSQQLFHIRIETQEVNLQEAFRNRTAGHRRWFTGKRCPNQDAVIAVVDCVDAQGTKKQNTIGFIRDSSTGQVYLVYFADTIAMDHVTVMNEISETLASLRVRTHTLVPNSVRKKLAWYAPPLPLESS